MELQPAYLIDVVPNRALLDRRVFCGLLVSTKTCTAPRAVWPPSDAPSRPSTAAMPAQQRPIRGVKLSPILATGIDSSVRF